VVPGDGLALAHQFARELGGTAVDLDRERSIGRLVLKGWTLDFAKQEGDSLPADLSRRDYTVNAIALLLPIGQKTLALIDPLQGLEDLRQQRMRALSEENLLNDPLRLLRGLRLATERMAEAVREGGGLSAAMRRADVFPPILVTMTASGEAGGRLEPMLERAAEYLEREFSTFTAVMLSLIEPAIIVVMGGVVALIVLSILLPILQINTLAMG